SQRIATRAEGALCARRLSSLRSLALVATDCDQSGRSASRSPPALATLALVATDCDQSGRSASRFALAACARYARSLRSQRIATRAEGVLRALRSPPALATLARSGRNGLRPERKE